MIFCRQILIITVIFLFFGQVARAESPLSKSFQLLKGVLENQQSNKNDSEIHSQNSLYWNNKADFLTAVSNGKMAGYDNVFGDKEKSLVLNSLRAILANDYHTKVPVVVNGSSGCKSAFDINADELLKLITRDEIERLGNNPPDFVSSSSVNKLSSAKANFSGLNENCSEEVLGIKISAPFINSLVSLLNEYSDVTKAYVNKLRVDKVAAYQITLKQEADSAKNLAEQNEQAERTKQISEKLEQKNKPALMHV